MIKFLNSEGLKRLVALIKQALGGKQDKLVSGTNIKTVNDNSLLGSGNLSLNDAAIPYDGNGTYALEDATNVQEALDILDDAVNGLDIPPHVVVNEDPTGGSQTIQNPELLNKIESITATESTASGGNNTVTITETNGTTTSFNVKNGTNGGNLGDIDVVDVTGDRADAVMSQKAVTEYGHKVTAEDLAGTSDWIRTKLTEEGWAFGKKLYANGTLVDNASTVVTNFIPLQNFNNRDGHQLTICINDYDRNVCYYDENKTFKNYTLVYNIKTEIPSSSIFQNNQYVRLTLNPNQIAESYIKDNTTGEYLWRGSEYLASLCDNNNLTEGVFENNVFKSGVVRDELREDITIPYNKFAWHTGGINDSTGADDDSESVCRSRYIEIPSDCDKIAISNTISGTYNIYAYLYNAKKEFIDSLGAIYREIKYIQKEDYPTAKYIRFKGTNTSVYVHQREYIAVSLVFKNCQKKTERNVLTAKGLDQHGVVYFKLSKNQVDLINSSDVISVLWIVGSGQDKNDYNRYFMPFYSSDTDTLRIGHSSGGAISKKNTTTSGSGTYVTGTERHGVCGLAVNRKTGEVKYYDRGRYVTTFTDSSFVLSKFVSNDGIFHINNASTNGAYFSILYNLSLYIGDIFDLLINSSDWLSMLDSIDGAHLCFAGVNKYNEIGRLNSDRQPISYGMLGTKSGTTYTVSTLPASTSKFTFASYSQPPYLRKYIKYLQITQGVARFPTLTNSNATQKLYNSNSSWEKLSEVSDYENVGVGYYILEDYGGSDLKQAGGDMRVVEVPFTVDVAGGQSTEQPWGCVANFKFDTLVDGKIYDEVTDQYYTPYSDAACNTPTTLNLSSVPFKKYCMFNKSTPTYIGEIKIYNNKIYVAQDMNTWKQINNS